MSINLKKNEEQLTNEVMNRISLSKDKEFLKDHVVNLSKCVIDLSKKAEVDLGDIKARVIVALDYSGSMCSLYGNGTVQKTLNRLVPLGLTFDDNGSVEVYLFQSDYKKVADMDLLNYKEYVKGVINRSGYDMGGTNYAPVLNAILGREEGSTGIFGKLFGKKKEVSANSDEITFVLFITDGENYDAHETDEVIRESSKTKTFIQFVGIGRENFKYLRKLDDLSGREVDNTGFTKMEDLACVSDSELYSKVLEQFADWLKVIK